MKEKNKLVNDNIIIVNLNISCLITKKLKEKKIFTPKFMYVLCEASRYQFSIKTNSSPTWLFCFPHNLYMKSTWLKRPLVRSQKIAYFPTYIVWLQSTTCERGKKIACCEPYLPVMSSRKKNLNYVHLWVSILIFWREKDL